jgi:hypothetical protein
VKLSPALVAANSQSPASGDVSIGPSKLVAVVSPQRRPQSEKKVYKHISVKLMIISEWNCLGVFHSAETFVVWVCFYTVAMPYLLEWITGCQNSFTQFFF